MSRPSASAARPDPALAPAEVAVLVARHRADGDRPDLALSVAAVLDGLGPGEVISYGEVAVEAGWPGRARAVGRILAVGGGRHRWWRVVNAAGRLAPGNEAEQADRLKAEGVEVDLARGRVAPSSPGR